MATIYTVTVNPCLDVVKILDKIEKLKEDTYRIFPEDEDRKAGGKGLDVSRVVFELSGTALASDRAEQEVKTTALGFIGGFTGERVDALLVNEGIECKFQEISDETRTNVILIVGSGSKEYRFNGTGPRFTPNSEMNAPGLRDVLEELPKAKGDTLAICGSLTTDMPRGYYRSIIEWGKDGGLFVAVDTSEDALLASLRTPPRPDLIKPNLDEFDKLLRGALRRALAADPQATEEWLGNNVLTTKKNYKVLVNCVLEYSQKHKETALLLSIGRGGTIFYDPKFEDVFHAYFPDKVTRHTTVGAGDALLGGFLAQRSSSSEDPDPVACLKLAVASATVRVSTTRAEERSKYIDGDRVEQIIEDDIVRVVQHQGGVITDWSPLAWWKRRPR